mmetsp:Transcript_1907/g.2742  ORF Transcript_1907/g.2742 Transcript_1907/m.2742 type:complete len:140 (-) Transcript_1907:153-572(-)
MNVEEAMSDIMDSTDLITIQFLLWPSRNSSTATTFHQNSRSSSLVRLLGFSSRFSVVVSQHVEETVASNTFRSIVVPSSDVPFPMYIDAASSQVYNVQLPFTSSECKCKQSVSTKVAFSYAIGLLLFAPSSKQAKPAMR